MSEIENQICPWCQTEIVWDPDIGAEDSCPHCLGELEQYRTVAFDTKVELDVNEKMSAEEIVELDFENEEDWYDYEMNVEKYLDLQEEQVICPVCQENMVYAGQQKLVKPDFKVYIPQSLPSFMNIPSTLNTYVCPSCFQIKTVLSQNDRMAIINKLNQLK